MALITIFLTVVSLTTPTLEELSQRTEPWVREDVTITSVSEFHTSDFLREDEPVLLLHHAFLDDENETLRTVVCTDTRVIVLEEGLVQREIVLEHTINHANVSPMGMFLVTHRNMDAPSSVRSLRVDTETGEQIHFTTHPGREMQVNEPWTWPQDDGSLVTRLGSYLWFFDTDLNPVQELRVSPWGSDVWAARNADIVFVSGTTLSAYNRRGELQWTISDEYNRARVNSAAISDDGSLVGLASRDGAFLFDGTTGTVVAEYFTTGNTGFGVGQIILSPLGKRFLVIRLDDRVIVSSGCLETGEQYSFALGARVRAILDCGIALLDSMVLDSHLNPYYVPGRHIYAVSSSGRRLVQASGWFPTHPNSAFAATGIQSVLPAGFQVMELQAGGN
jgi:hypothetical protein